MPSATFAALAMSEILALKKPFLAKTLTAARIIFSCLSEFFMNNSSFKARRGGLKSTVKLDECLFI